MFAIVDCFDAMTADRPYRAALPLEHAVEEIEKGAGTQFDPEIVRTFIDMFPDIREMHGVRARA
jgi:HD-GYP domain-containing protein (c-di-GMP phosphodiesterase class II)